MSEQTNKFFIIKKNQWRHRGYATYEIMKEKPFTLEEATRNLLAYEQLNGDKDCLLYTSPSPRDKRQSRMPSSA